MAETLNDGFDGGGDDLDFGLEDGSEGLDDCGFLDDCAEDQVYAPRLKKPVVSAYRNARAMAERLALEKDCNYYAFVSGAFVFGDILEAWAERHKIREIYVSTLGLGVENVDSLINCIALHGARRVNLIVSHYFFGVERHRLVRYISEEIGGLPFRVAVAAWASMGF